MIEVSSTWDQVEVGTTLLTPTRLPVLVVQKAPDKRGRMWFQVEDRNHHKSRVEPKPPGTPVTVLEVTEEEAIKNVVERLGAHAMLDFETEARMAERAKRWVVDPLPTKGARALDRARDHVSWYHGAYAGDAAVSGGFKTLKEILKAHEEMHELDSSGQPFMDRPHQHRRED